MQYQQVTPMEASQSSFYPTTSAPPTIVQVQPNVTSVPTATSIPAVP